MFSSSRLVIRSLYMYPADFGKIRVWVPRKCRVQHGGIATSFCCIELLNLIFNTKEQKNRTNNQSNNIEILLYQINNSSKFTKKQINKQNKLKETNNYVRIC